MCILFVYTLLKVVSYYDLSVLSSAHVSDGVPKKVWIVCRWVGFFGIF